MFILFHRNMGSSIPAFLVLCVAGLLLFTPGANAQERSDIKLALVIGNSDYVSVPKLRNPQNDALDLSAALEGIGFDVTLGTNLDFAQMRIALRDFSERAENADIVLIYFAGHGIEVGGDNYLIPVNAELERDKDVEFETIRLNTVLASLDGLDALKIVLIDACRNNPFAAQMAQRRQTRSIGRGLARIEPSGILVGYAAKGGTVALDGNGRNSPYTAALLQHLEEPGLELGKLFRKVRDTVFAATAGAQEPFVYGSLPGRDIFLVPSAASKPKQPEQRQAALPDVSPDTITKDFSKAISANTVSGWRSFLEKHADQPDHRLQPLAQRWYTTARHEAEERRGFVARDPWLTSALAENGRTVSLDRQDRILIQKALSMMGFDPGAPDGQFGPKTKKALAAARLHANLGPGTTVDYPLLRVLPNVPATEALYSKKARIYSPDEFETDIEPRLRKALRTYKNTQVRFGYFDGHLYLAVHTTVGDWDFARRMAKRAGGTLAVIGSAAENNFLVSLFSGDSRFVHTEPEGAKYGPMFGLYQADRSREPGGGWAWVNGDPITFRGWNKGNPDNYRLRQHWARFYRPRKYAGSNVAVRFWDDSTSGLWSGGYLIEIE